MKLLSGSLLMGLSLIGLTINECTQALGDFKVGFNDVEHAIELIAAEMGAETSRLIWPIQGGIWRGGEDFGFLIWFFMLLGVAMFVWGILEEVFSLLKRPKNDR